MRRGLFVLVCLASIANAQAPTTVDVRVVSPLGEALKYSTISVSPGEPQFTSEEGKYRFIAPSPGRYQVRVKHLGFTALDTVVAVTGQGHLDVTIMLRPVALRLSAVEVREKNSCRSARTPGSNLYIALEEFRKNAERDQLLRNSYPFTYRLARRYSSVDEGMFGRRSVKHDTVSFGSVTTNRYRPGDVFIPANSNERGGQEVRIPSLADLADEEFLRNHCFSYAGMATVGSVRAYRIDYSPIREISGPDFEGSAYLDSATYMILKAEFRLTRPDRASPPILGLRVTTTFRELLPGLPLFDTIRGVQPVGRTELIEDQKLIDVVFMRRPPGFDPSR